MAINHRRTIPDFARQTQWIVDVAYLEALVIRVVLDNLSIHRMASIHVTFPLPRLVTS